MKFQKVLAVFLTVFIHSNALLVPIIYEDYEICVDDEHRAKKFDFSYLEIIAVSDYKVYLNGTWKILGDVKSPWAVTIFTEKYIRNQWSVVILNKKIPDFCEVVQKITEPWYYVTSHFIPKNCPFPAGVRVFVAYFWTCQFGNASFTKFTVFPSFVHPKSNSFKLGLESFEKTEKRFRFSILSDSDSKAWFQVIDFKDKSDDRSDYCRF